MKSNRRIIEEAILLSFVSCSCFYGFVIINTHHRASFLGAIICVMPIVLPITHLAWHHSRRKLERFRAAPWPQFEQYARYVHGLRDSQVYFLDVQLRFWGVGTQCIGHVMLPAGPYQIDTESPPGDDTHFDIRPNPDADEVVQLLSGNGACTRPLTVVEGLTAYLCVTTPAPDMPWTCFITSRDPKQPTSLDQELFEQPIYYMMQRSGDWTGAAVKLSAGDYDLSWNTPFSQIGVELEDVSGSQPSVVIVNRALYKKYPFWRGIHFTISQEGHYRFKVTVQSGAHTDRWSIACQGM
jgi:hypothetical protein